MFYSISCLGVLAVTSTVCAVPKQLLARDCAETSGQADNSFQGY